METIIVYREYSQVHTQVHHLLQYSYERSVFLRDMFLDLCVCNITREKFVSSENKLKLQLNDSKQTF